MTFLWVEWVLDAQFVVVTRITTIFHIPWADSKVIIAFEFIKTGKNVLEVGNVLYHYPIQQMGRDIIDKYEKEGGVINRDILEYKPGCK
jgi:hypothetical protein